MLCSPSRSSWGPLGDEAASDDSSASRGLQGSGWGPAPTTLLLGSTPRFPDTCASQDQGAGGGPHLGQTHLP